MNKLKYPVKYLTAIKNVLSPSSEKKINKNACMKSLIKDKMLMEKKLKSQRTHHKRIIKLNEWNHRS